MIKKSLSMTLIALMMLSGCTSKSANSTAAPSQTTTPNTAQAVTQQTQSTKTQPPSQLDSLESDSEDIIDDITKINWTSAKSKSADIKAKFSELSPILTKDSVSTDIISGMESTIAKLENAVDAKQSYEARVQANQISNYIPDVADYYTTTIPTNIGRLDYLGREILLDAENSDWTSAASNCQTASSLWNGLKAQMSSSYKTDIDTFQSNLDNLKSAIDKKDSAETAKQADALLENIDTLEKDFTNP